MHESMLPHESLTMLPETQARRLLIGHALTFAILRPPYPALGVGTLRVLRVRENADAGLEIFAGYDNYERLGAFVGRNSSSDPCAERILDESQRAIAITPAESRMPGESGSQNAMDFASLVQTDLPNS